MWHSAIGFLAVATAVALIVRHFGAPRAVIYGFVATGLGAPIVARQPKPQLVVSQKTGTDNQPLVASGAVDYNQLDSVPAVIRRNRASTVEALQQSGVDKYDIPAFLRRQAD